MAADAYLRIVLTVIAVCLLMLVVQGFQRNELLAGAADAPATLTDRFQFVPVMRSRMAFRFDKMTGATSKMPFPQSTGWVSVPELGAEEPEVEAPATEPPTPPPGAAEVPRPPN